MNLLNEMERGDCGHMPPLSNNTVNYKQKTIECINEHQLLNATKVMNEVQGTPSIDINDNTHKHSIHNENYVVLINSKGNTYSRTPIPILEENVNLNITMNNFPDTTAIDTDEIKHVPLQTENGIVLLNSNKNTSIKTQLLDKTYDQIAVPNKLHETLAIDKDERQNIQINTENYTVSINSNEKTHSIKEPNDIVAIEGTLAQSIAEYKDNTTNVEFNISIKNDNQDEDCNNINKICNDIEAELYLETNLSNTEPNASVNELYKSNNEDLFVDINDFDDTNVTDMETCDTWIDLEEFDNILKTRQITTNDNDSLIYLDEVDEYIKNIDETALTKFDNKKDEFNNETLTDCDDNLEIISISSDDENKDDSETREDPNIDTESINSSECGSYHSSDFEFITENEAKIDGLINYNPTMKRNMRKDSLVIRRQFSDNSPGSNKKMHAFSNDNNVPPRQNHIVPEGPSFLALFQGVYNPVLPHSAIFFLENKSVRVTSMHTQFDGLGFDRDMARRQQHFSKEYEDEAIENAKKILDMYPGENRKRRRRY